MPPVQGLGESALYVADRARSLQFYQELFGFKRVAHDENFGALRVNATQVLLFFKKHSRDEPFSTPGGTIPPHGAEGQLHLAFTISPAELDPWREHLKLRGIKVESEVEWGPGLRSLYFREPDGHLIELATPGLWKTD